MEKTEKGRRGQNGERMDEWNQSEERSVWLFAAWSVIGHQITSLHSIYTVCAVIEPHIYSDKALRALQLRLQTKIRDLTRALQETSRLHLNFLIYKKMSHFSDLKNIIIIRWGTMCWTEQPDIRAGSHWYISLWFHFGTAINDYFRYRFFFLNNSPLVIQFIIC